MSVSRISREVISLLLVGLLIFLFFFVDFTKLSQLSENVPATFLNMNTIFLSIFLEAAPFILIGVFVSSIIQTFVTEEQIKRIIPRNPIIAMIPALCIGIVFPMCECVIIPIVRRLLQKGVPLHVGMTMLVSVPIINPIVFASTFYAFRAAPHIVYYRIGLAMVAAMVIGFCMYLLYRNEAVLREKLQTASPHNHNQTDGRWMQIFQHATDEFFQTGKLLLMGACIASLFQTFLDRQVLAQVASNDVIAPAVMMTFSYILSLCSEADAFIAASFNQTFSASSLLAFLIFGPMLDVKNTLMLLAYFKKRFVMAFLIIVTLVVYIVVQLAPL